jgi:multiple sugar transport system ATP-binding protein
MSAVEFQHVYKIYPNHHSVIKDLCLEIKDGEFMIFVGPSGCGKSTALRMLAGLEDISAGKLLIDGQVMNDCTPQQRNIAMVFQNYALYPHMTVRQNMEFPLRMIKMSPQQIKLRVNEAADKLGLGQLLDRKPKQLSGGQRQRVAMGRAIVRDPAVFLMDEPLSNLDAKMRAQIRTEISELQRRLATTTVYVTHDQVEAMTMGDRVVVMRSGELQQVADPQELYEHPANIFVAGFIGSPAMNIFRTKLHKAESGQYTIDFGGKTLSIDAAAVVRHRQLDNYVNQRIIAGLRPEAFALATTSPPLDRTCEVRVRSCEPLGHETIVYATVDIELIQVEDGHTEVQNGPDDLEIGSTLVMRLSAYQQFTPDTMLRLAVDTSQLYFFDAQGQAMD